jgi:chromosome segregation ATPase
MATNVVALTPATTQPLSNIQTEVKSLFDARDRLQSLLDLLATQRRHAVNAFLRAFAADLAAVKADPDRAFVDAQFAKFTTWKTADEETAKRIDALTVVHVSLDKRIEEFETAYRDEVIELLTRQIAALNEQLKEKESDEAALNRRIKDLTYELDRVRKEPAAATAKSPAAARKGKK